MIYTLLGEEGGPTSLHKGAAVCIEPQRRGLWGRATHGGNWPAHRQKLYLLCKWKYAVQSNTDWLHRKYQVASGPGWVPHELHTLSGQCSAFYTNMCTSRTCLGHLVIINQVFLRLFACRYKYSLCRGVYIHPFFTFCFPIQSKRISKNLLMTTAPT